MLASNYCRLIFIINLHQLNQINQVNQGPQRLLSLDFMRGFIMVLLALESTGLCEHLSDVSQGTFFYGIMQQFFHHTRHGLHFWDFIQPGLFLWLVFPWLTH